MVPSRGATSPIPCDAPFRTPIARVLMGYLKAATDSGGTGTKAQLDCLQGGGQDRHGEGQVGRVSSVFRREFFPADNPQAVIYVMIDRPSKGKFYGGDVAAPIVRAVMKQALALQRSPFDRSSLTTAVAVAPVTRVAGSGIGGDPPRRVAARGGAPDHGASGRFRRRAVAGAGGRTGRSSAPALPCASWVVPAFARRLRWPEIRCLAAPRSRSTPIRCHEVAGDRRMPCAVTTWSCRQPTPTCDILRIDVDSRAVEAGNVVHRDSRLGGRRPQVHSAGAGEWRIGPGHRATGRVRRFPSSWFAMGGAPRRSSPRRGTIIRRGSCSWSASPAPTARPPRPR